MSEHDEQCALFQWIDIELNRPSPIPGLEMVYSTTRGNTGGRTGGYLRDEGVRAGIFDINVDTSRHGFHGLRIELKTKTGTLTKEQRVWFQRFRTHGFMAVVCRGWEAAMDTIIDYLR